MMNETPGRSPIPKIAIRLTVFVAVLTALVVVIVFITRFFGLVDWIYSEPTLLVVSGVIVTVLSALVLKSFNWILRKTPVVTIDVVEDKESRSGSQCVKFSFSSLPANFVLEKIHLDIIDAMGTDVRTISYRPITVRNLAHRPFENRVTTEVSPPYPPGKKTKIVVRCPVQADKAEDTFFIHWCPILRSSWTRASLTVVPTTFSDATGEPIEGLKVRTTSGVSINDGVKVAIVGPPDLRQTH